MAVDLWLLELSFSQRAFDLHPLIEPQPWYRGHDWRPLALGEAAALESLAARLEESWR